MNLVLIFLCGFVLQGLLSMVDKKIFGLILPTLTFLSSMVVFLNLSNIADLTKFEVIFMGVFSLILFNIPTLLFVMLFFFVKRKSGSFVRHKKAQPQVQMN